MRWWARTVLAVLLAATCARAEELPPPDADGDGVADDADACPDSPTYALVDDEGCSVCDCDADANGDPWEGRGAYLRCVLTEVHARRGDDRLDRKAARLVVKAARNSTCGYQTRVRCCIMFPGKATGMCKVVDELRCGAEMLHVEVAEDLAGGSCFPNPCVAE